MRSLCAIEDTSLPNMPSNLKTDFFFFYGEKSNQNNICISTSWKKMKSNKIAIGSDHAAYEMKAEMLKFLQSKGHSVVDCGTFSNDRVDYPDYAAVVCGMVNKKEVDYGVLFCGTGIGISISANKIQGIRAALCHDHYTAQMAREHNDANVICAGARVTGSEVVKDMLEVFLATPFAGQHHTARVEKIMALYGSDCVMCAPAEKKQ